MYFYLSTVYQNRSDYFEGGTRAVLANPSLQLVCEKQRLLTEYEELVNEQEFWVGKTFIVSLGHLISYCYRLNQMTGRYPEYIPLYEKSPSSNMSFELTVSTLHIWLAFIISRAHGPCVFCYFSPFHYVY